MEKRKSGSGKKKQNVEDLAQSMGLLSNGLAQTLPVVRRFCFLFLVFFLMSFGLRDSLFDTDLEC